MISSRRAGGRLRTVLHALGLAVVFLIVNAQVAYAADGGQDMMGPLNVDSSEGVPINGYELSAQGGSIFSVRTNAYAFLMNGLFTLLRLVVGLSCWAIAFALRFPLIKMLADPAQKLSTIYDDIVVDTLGIKGLLLAWAFIFGGILLVRGKAGKGLGEIILTLVIAAFAASAFVRPDYLLGQDGPLAQSERSAFEVAQMTVDSYDWGGKIASGDAGPCGGGLSGPALEKCYQEQKKKQGSASRVAQPIQDALTNVTVVKGYMLVQYGRILDPAKASDRKAYALHLKWVSGGYKPTSAASKADRQHAEDVCDKIKGPAHKYCVKGKLKNPAPDQPPLKEGPALTPGDALLDAATPVLNSQDQQFAAFLTEMEKAGPVGKAAAEYAKEPTGWRTAGVLLLFAAALLISAIPLSAAFVLLGLQAADAAAAAVGAVTLVWAMLPGPNRQAAFKWLALLGISVAGMFAICTFLPSYAIGIDVVLTDGPDVPAERLLALNALALAALAFHRRLLAGITSAGQRLSLRMRYAKIGGTHLPGDTSEIGAALAVHGNAALRGGMGLRAWGGSGYGRLGTRQRLMRSLAAMTDGTGMPVDPGRLLSDAGAEASRGLAPLSLAATGVGLGARGAWGLLVGRHPGAMALEKMRKPTAAGDPPGSGPQDDNERGRGPKGPQADSLRQGPADRYRNEHGIIPDQTSGEPLHDQNVDRTLLSTRAHNRLVRLRGYRILHRTGRVAYGVSDGLPTTTRRARQAASEHTKDAKQQVRVWSNTVREDLRSWRPRGASPAARPGRTDGGGPGPAPSGHGLPPMPPMPSGPAEPDWPARVATPRIRSTATPDSATRGGRTPATTTDSTTSGGRSPAPTPPQAAPDPDESMRWRPRIDPAEMRRSAPTDPDELRRRLADRQRVRPEELRRRFAEERRAREESERRDRANPHEEDR
ncbi:hypothetical protein [Streptomyces sp. NPDC051214]|uniref:hypothetical protein n=1 Tax=Streptomyces sp. NPDC051214 TaxID=3155282 RepID=UPI0034434A11